VTDALETFDIDPSDATARFQLDLATYLLERGVPVEKIRATRTLEELNLLLWATIFGIAGDPISSSDASARSGLSEAQLRRVFGALGFSGSTSGAVVTSDDTDLLEAFNVMIAFLGEEQLLQMARVLGSSARRIAEAASATTRVSIETPMLQEGSYIDFVRSTADALEIGMGLLGRVLDRAIRYHLLDISRQAWGVDAEAAAVTLNLTIGFADMVGFTAHSASLQTHDLAAVIDGFEGRVSEVITMSGGRVVKFIGDEVMFAFEDTAAACACAKDLLALALDARIPDVRIGLAHGTVISRYGDYYGPIVNLAARLVDVAPQGGVLLTPDVAARAPAFALEVQEPVWVKGIDRPVEHLRLITS